MALIRMRLLTPAQQEVVRKRAVRAVEQGRSQREVSSVLGVTRASVNRWVAEYRDQGDAALQSHKRGRPPQEVLDHQHLQDFVRTLCSPPETFGLRATVWTRARVQEVLERDHGIVASRWSMKRYLSRWGLVPPSDALKRKCASAAGTLHYRLRADVLPARGHYIMLSAIGGRGEHHFLIYPRPCVAEDVIDFLVRLKSESRLPIVISSETGLVRDTTVQRWLRTSASGIHLNGS